MVLCYLENYPFSNIKRNTWLVVWSVAFKPFNLRYFVQSGTKSRSVNFDTFRFFGSHYEGLDDISMWISLQNAYFISISRIFERFHQLNHKRFLKLLEGR